MKNSQIISAALLFTAVSALAEGDPARGKALTGACVACHQEDGNGRDNGASADAWPRLAGMNAEYLAAQLAAYKKGERRAPSMKPFSMMLDDAANSWQNRATPANKSNPAPNAMARTTAATAKSPPSPPNPHPTCAHKSPRGNRATARTTAPTRKACSRPRAIWMTPTAPPSPPGSRRRRRRARRRSGEWAHAAWEM